MSPDGDVTEWIRQLQAGEREGVQRLWEGYYRHLVSIARQKLGQVPRGGVDEEDVALSAFDSFIRGAEGGRFPQLADRDDLWQLLVVITKRKAADLIGYLKRRKRDHRRVQQDAGEDGSLLRDLLGKEPDPAFAAQVGEECQRLLACLRDDELRNIALRKMEGDTNQEIADQLTLALSTVERRFVLIRKAWTRTACAKEELLPKS